MDNDTSRFRPDGFEKVVLRLCSLSDTFIALTDQVERIFEGGEEFRRELGLEGSSLHRLIEVGYGILDLITFYTTVSSELKAWTVRKGTPASRAAGKIHSDMERGFIRAEILSFSDFVACGSEHTAKERGLLRSEGKDHPVQDGDIIHFRFNV